MFWAIIKKNDRLDIQMVGIIITGHSNFATGIVSAVRLVAGEQKNLEVVDFYDTYST